MTLLNGHLNGNNSNGKHQASKQDSQVLTAESKAPKKSSFNEFNHSLEQSVVLRQSPVWSRAILVTLMMLACFGIAWACVAKIEQVIPAQGQLKPEGTVKEIQAPVNGVVKAVYVKDGQQVKPGDLLILFDSTATTAELDSLKKIRAAVIQENQIYRRLMEAGSGLAAEVEFLRGNLSKEAAFLLKSRAAVIADNSLLRTQLKNSAPGADLGSDERDRLQAAKKESDSRSAAARLQVEQSRKKLTQNQVQIGASKASLAIEQQIMNKMKILAEEGAIAQLQYLQQKQKVQEIAAQIASLTEEGQRIQYEIQQGQQQANNTVAVSDKTVLDKIADNKQRIAEIDSQLSRILIDNEKQLTEINSKIAQSQMNVKYQALRAPVAGTIFDLQAKNPGFVANTTQKLLQIVPTDSYIAETFVTNKDIGFVREGMKVDVRVDSFPYSEFGDIKGEVVSVASDALPPDQTHQYYRFPVRVRLDKQQLNIKGRDISLQSGMSITANIKVREERTVMSLFTDMFTQQVDSLKQVR
ncbi:HlyD family efflux transporter periplasmic adaptor subunit [Iningainema tapete]|uniref:HlyD family efflux transporter periplasmic adaptor subunit n=1 Tax=Iningainema tapete BLCC-T55 TaxID=2748662 RepID=A0A8J6XDT4_9CYAN|nr:HlyD family efflux transporter periplasmic adaptor subunit [Iningainema tapete]MBD2771743.1 HlyD family efflux transporter periplasmic adaptor subunit [Iningainema tapete BLCC-T55]